MGFIKRLIERHRQKIAEKNAKCDNLISRINDACSVADSYIADKKAYVDVQLASQWRQTYLSLKDEANSKATLSLKKATRYKELLSAISLLNGKYDLLPHNIDKHNEEVAAAQLNDAYSLIGNVEGCRLDKQQMLAIIKETHNHLVIAGAGTGKTTTVVGKIKYLLKSGKCRPEDILVLSFTNASAAEMSERINKETGYKIAASTFHKLGLNIITKSVGIKPKITQINLHTFIKEKMSGLMGDERYVRALSSYLLYNKVSAKSEFEFKTEKDYKEYLLLNPPITINNEKVKSYGEMDIANFLLQHGVSYIYEAAYKIDTRTSEYGQYYPDFYLPDYDIYIEYFGIDKNGNVPRWFSSKKDKTPTQVYQESMEWKRRIHKENGTTLIECYAYEKLDGSLLDNLSKKLSECNVALENKSSGEVWAMAAQEDSGIIDGLIELFETVINLVKSNNYTMHEFRSVAATSSNAARYMQFIDLIEPLYNAYEQELKKNGEIDFNDMINDATECVLCGKVANPFSCVIVDEYQDISKSRYLLLSALRKSKDYDLFCVGDDWQSIYRFAGSDISYILNFENYWGSTTISKIETTYRFTPSLIDISGTFITQNPNQIRKQIQGASSDYRFSLGEINGYNDKYAVEFMAAKLEDLPQNSSVFFIGRYSFDIDIIKDNELFTCKYNNISGFVDVVYRRRQDLKICFLTAHKSKGLQADYVFIINNKSSRMGFPSRIQDDPILDLLLDNSENYPFAEERRLYYVALTRAKTKSFFLTVKDSESVFAQELHTRYERQLKREQFECPLCGGTLVRKTGPYGDFLGCENYKTTGCKFKRKIHSKSQQALNGNPRTSF